MSPTARARDVPTRGAHEESCRDRDRFHVERAKVRSLLIMDFSSWLTKQQAADALRVSKKTVEAMAKRGELQKERWRRPETGQRLVVYHPGDVARLAQERHPAATAGFVVPDPGSNGKGHGGLAVTRPPTSEADPLRTFATVLLSAWAELSQAAKPAKAEKPTFLTLPEAAAWTGLTEAYLRRKCRDGSLKALKDQGWKIKRTDLETL
jgi:Helix-turn-helix domain